MSISDVGSLTRPIISVKDLAVAYGYNTIFDSISTQGSQLLTSVSTQGRQQRLSQISDAIRLEVKKQEFLAPYVLFQCCSKLPCLICFSERFSSFLTWIFLVF